MTTTTGPDLLESGIYTIGDAARLLKTKSAKVRSWVNGVGAHQRPLIENQLGRIGNHSVISFTNLMELRFVACFEEAGVPLRAIRAILENAKDVLSHPHPFATATVFGTDGRRVLALIDRHTGQTDILDLKSKNYEIPEFAVLKPGIVFDAKGRASAWFPRQKTAPNVVLHPHFSFGRPILRASKIPTATIASAAKIDGVDDTAIIFDVPIKQVREAVAFQEQLRSVA
jgi:uncharacterized protein (DUF433 family)